MSIYIGIEGVGMRKSLAVASGPDGKILAVACIPRGISLHTTPRHVLRSCLFDLLISLAKQMHVKVTDLNEATVCIGLAGVTFHYDRTVDLPSEFARLPVEFNKNVICTGDAEIYIASHTKSNTGSAVSCQMGSIAVAMNEGKCYRYGGWGPALGDEGSAYWMGRSALRAIAAEFDQDFAQSELWKCINRWLDNPVPNLHIWSEASILWRKIKKQFKERISNPLEGEDYRPALFAFAHEICSRDTEAWRPIASGLSIPLMEAWDKNDTMATSSVEAAALMLANQYLKIESKSEGPLVLYGGVITHNKKFADELQKVIKNKYNENNTKLSSKKPPKIPAQRNGATKTETEIEFPHTIIVAGKTAGSLRPVCGALLFALGESETGDLRLPGEKAKNNVTQTSAEWEELKND